MINLNQMRREMKACRRQLTLQQRAGYSSKIISKVTSQFWFHKSQSIAFYLAANAEVDTQPLLDQALKEGKKCYLPVLHPLKSNTLWFVAFESDQTLVKNKYHILEPKIDSKTAVVPPWALDLVFMPLVAFDSACYRLGMGGGYYDRTFAFVNESFASKPRLVGLAYEMQKVTELEPNPWDIRMDAVVTEEHIYISEP